MKTWRERIAAAKRRGYWTKDDDRRYNNMGTCLAAEVTAQFLSWSEVRRRLRSDRAGGAGPGLLAQDWPWSKLWRLGDEASISADLMPHWFHRNVARAEKILDRMEDQALQIKRGDA